MVTVDNLTDEFDGLSTDTKPTDGVRNGSEFYEMDTEKEFVYDEQNGQWIEKESFIIEDATGVEF